MTMQQRRVTSALFIDFDNAYSTLNTVDHALAQAFVQDAASWLERLRDGLDEDGPFTRRFLQTSVYLNPGPYGPHRATLTRAGFRVVDCPSLTKAGKSSADMWMAVDILDAIAHPTRFEEFVIFSSDADFTPIVHRIRTFDRKTTIITTGFAAAAYRASADHVIDGAQFARILGVGGNEIEAVPTPSGLVHHDTPVDPGLDEPNADAPATDLSAAAAEHEALRLAVAQAIVDVVLRAPGPVPSATAAAAARKIDHSLPSSKWDGLGFLGWVKANLDGVGTSAEGPGFVWDASRFDAPATFERLTPLQMQVASVTDVPRLTEEQYAALHGALAVTISADGLTMAGTPGRVKGLLASVHPPVSMRAITEVVRGLLLDVDGQFAGTITDSQVAGQWADLVVGLAEGSLVDLTEEDRLTLRKWLGGGLALSEPCNTPDVEGSEVACTV